MTIEEKVRELILKQDIAAGYDKNGHARQERVEKFTQAIFALIKPMSKKRLFKLIADYKCSYPFVHSNGDNYIGDENAEGIADAILAEWGKE